MLALQTVGRRVPAQAQSKRENSTAQQGETHYRWNISLAYAPSKMRESDVNTRKGWFQEVVYAISISTSLLSSHQAQLCVHNCHSQVFSRFPTNITNTLNKQALYKRALWLSLLSSHTRVTEKNDQSLPFGHFITTHPSNKCSCFRSSDGVTVPMQF